MRLLPYGRAAILVELDEASSVVRYSAAFASLAGVVEVVPGARTVLVRVTPGALERVTSVVAATRIDQIVPAEVSSRVVEIEVRYDGADLEAVAGETGLTPDQVVERHAASEYVVRFCGFAPGFAYLDGLDPLLHVPRRSEPRSGVPAGSVAVAGEFSAVYPRSSPGGWQLLGTTDAKLWDVDADPPAVLAPGTRVRFIPS
jgi:KipI family sensor histidine kinase inhibitor